MSLSSKQRLHRLKLSHDRVARRQAERVLRTLLYQGRHHKGSGEGYDGGSHHYELHLPFFPGDEPGRGHRRQVDYPEDYEPFALRPDHYYEPFALRPDHYYETLTHKPRRKP